jgi:hypothetical protein
MADPALPGTDFDGDRALSEKEDSMFTGAR